MGANIYRNTFPEKERILVARDDLCRQQKKIQDVVVLPEDILLIFRQSKRVRDLHANDCETSSLTCIKYHPHF